MLLRLLVRPILRSIPYRLVKSIGCTTDSANSEGLIGASRLSSIDERQDLFKGKKEVALDTHEASF